MITKIATKELLSVLVLGIVLLTSMIPSLLYARGERADGVRRQEVLQLKRNLERYYNKHNYYPLTFETGRHEYVVIGAEHNQATAWYVRAQLKNNLLPAQGLDLEYNVYYRIVREEEKTFYDICGGIFTCNVEGDV